MREGCGTSVGKNVRCRGQWTGRVWLSSRLGVGTIPSCWLGPAAGTGVLKPSPVHCHPTEEGWGRAQTQPLRGGTHLSFIYSDNCGWVFFLFQYPRSKLLEVPEHSSCSHAACEQPTPSATALPFPLKLGGKHVTAITCLCILFDLLLQLKFILVREAFDRTFASQRFSPWSWAGSVPVAKHSALQLKLEIQGFNLFVKQQVQQMKLYILLILSLLVWKKSMILITQFIAWVTSLDFRRIHN